MSGYRKAQSLDGTWILALDPRDVGVVERWYEPGRAPEGIEVRVPSIWDLWAPDYDGVGWYFRTFTLDSSWFSGRRLELHFEAADYYAEAWLNGMRLGEHEGGYTPFDLDATSAARDGDNFLAVRIIDPHAPDGYGDFKPRQIPASKEGGYFSFAGLWGSVAAVSKPELSIDDVFVMPDIRRKRITATIETKAPAEIVAQILGTPHEARAEAGKIQLPFPDCEFWSPETPVLYTLRCELIRNGETVDSVDIRFGMREFTVRDQRFCLNNRPIFIKAALHQPDYARSLVAPETAELARRELQLAKDAGFNMVRLHIKTAPRITLDLADELGLLLYEEPPIGWIEKSPFLKERCEHEVREMILRDRNHPSVVIWGMLNESGNAGYVIGGGAQLVKDDLCQLARSLDPTRLIIDDSGGVNATREPARMLRPYQDALEPYDDLHIYQRAPVDREIELYYTHGGSAKRLYFLSEFGFGGMEDLGDTIAQYGPEPDRFKDARFLKAGLEAMEKGFHERELERVFGDFSSFAESTRALQCDAVRHQIDALRANPRLAGYCYTQLCDAGHEFCAGFLDRWRRVKPAFEALRDAQRPLRPLIQMSRTNLRPREEAEVTVILANDVRAEGRADLSLQVVGPTTQVLWKKKRNVKLSSTGGVLWSGAISASGSTGSHRFVVRLVQARQIIAESSIEFFVFAQAQPASMEINLLDPAGSYRSAVAPYAQPGSLRSPVHVVPPLANTIRAYPAEELAAILGQTRDGAVTILFSPPSDWNDLADQIDPSVRATSKDAVGAFLGVYHYVKLHPVFEGLPARRLMRQEYRNIVAPKAFIEVGDEDICGSFDASPIAAGNFMIDESVWWGTDILVRRYGAGRLVFTHLRVLDQLESDPVAGRLFVNLLEHFLRRAVPSDTVAPLHQGALEWLQRERPGVRRWMIAGMFDNWGGDGHDIAYPPEVAFNPLEVFDGWYKKFSWRPWYSRADDAHRINLQEALTPIYEYYPRFDYGVAYAYAEFTNDQRQAVDIKLRAQDAMKVWLNGSLVFETLEHRPHLDLADHRIRVLIKQGRNTLLVKVSKVPGEFQFALDIKPIGKDRIELRWWR